ncbi:hypothetical protein GGP41_004895 [Bipolaris sorokiniana]|uniref:Extracellular membrane protein CFEM domain-containing protein n=2 Tax=Cochliobolus sativus TaxID=45130 RepID=A0A8H6DUE3_COCSA|nr:uncharacterized protein COCSADRAFT_31858 [Bipolaris sorokiniana ND90Pr]EMD69090.1 hypothetical protein COCSADRAFT_31858 [Bipolaris sorokiniana ND90Pr]KAF5846795.1 hypothetical protein GGP41_004895 [Bipolaris sorokiniana]
MFPKFGVLFLLLAGLALAREIPPTSPTIAPASTITPAPLAHEDVFKRAVGTCGFIRGDSASPVTCGAGYNCVTTLRAQYAFACCNNVECIDDWSVCRPFGQKDCMGNNLPDDTCSRIYGSILQCSEAAPYCVTYMRSSTLSDEITFVSLTCGTTSEDVLVLATVTNGAKQTASGKPAAEQTESADPLAGFPSIPGLSSPTGTTSTRNSPAPTGSGSNGPALSTRSIVIISVVGAVVIFLGVGIGVCCWRKKAKDWWRERRNRNKHIIDPARIPQAQYQRTNYQPSNYQPTDPGLINSWRNGTPLGASPDVDPSVNGSVYGGYGGRGANGAAPRPMTTVPEQ